MVVLDSTAFYAGIPFTSTSAYYTTPQVLREIAHRQMARAVLDSLLESGRLVAESPDATFQERVRALAARSGDIGKVSDTDVSVLALALQLSGRSLRATIISDDYSVENLSRLLGLECRPVMTRGIARAVEWVVYCRGCGKVFRNKRAAVCDVCGTALRRRFAKAG